MNDSGFIAIRFCVGIVVKWALTFAPWRQAFSVCTSAFDQVWIHHRWAFHSSPKASLHQVSAVVRFGPVPLSRLFLFGARYPAGAALMQRRASRPGQNASSVARGVKGYGGLPLIPRLFRRHLAISVARGFWLSFVALFA